MLKLAIIGCLCAALVVKGQGAPPTPPGQPTPPSPMNNIYLEQTEHNRAARQAIPMMPPGMPGMSELQGAFPGNMGMQGLGNIPDPTAAMAKVQEMGKQVFNGRRRRQAPTSMRPPV